MLEMAEDKQVTPSTPQETPVEVVNEGQNKGTEHVFNEQTNYVPKRTIITVYTGTLSMRRAMLSYIDLPGLLDRRPRRIDGPDYSRSQFVHHRECIGSQ